MEPEAVDETGAEALKMSSCIPTDACDSPKQITPRDKSDLASRNLNWLNQHRRCDIKPSKQIPPSPFLVLAFARSHPTSPLPSMSANLYDILGVQRDATDDQSMSNPRPSLVPPSQSLRPRSPKSLQETGLANPPGSRSPRTESHRRGRVPKGYSNPTFTPSARLTLDVLGQ